MKCEKCKSEHDGSYGSGRFCSESCARSYSTKNDSYELKEVICNDCGMLTRVGKRASAQNSFCPPCKRKRQLERWRRNNAKRTGSSYKPKAEVDSILDISKRTISKVVQRMSLECTICKWQVDGVSGDIHHIIAKAKGGSDDMSNLIYVCPNCHRMLHSGCIAEDKIIPLNDYIGDSWKDFYNVE